MSTFPQKNISRRRWLQLSALLAGSMSMLYSPAHSFTRPTGQFQRMRKLEEELLRATPPTLKARLFANENPWGPSPKAQAAAREAVSLGNRYPMREGFAFMEKLAAQEKLSPEQIYPTPGSSAVLATLAAYYAKMGGKLLTSELSYEHLPESAEAMGMTVKRIPVTKDLQLDLPALEAAVDSQTRAVYICNPNNPSGTALDADALRAFCHRVSPKATVIVDEAYLHYLDEQEKNSMIDCVREGKNVLVARTFSKVYGFAGLRMGFLAGSKELMPELDAMAAGPYGMSIISIAAASAALDDTEFIQEVRQHTAASKEQLYATLKGEGYSYIPSATNFVLFPLQMEGQRFSDEMFKRGVGIRHWEYNNQPWCRVSLGRPDEMEAFTEAFKQLS